MLLVKSQIKQLRTLAHKLKPVIWIGQNGLTDNVMEEIEVALTHHELIKIKLRLDESEDSEIISETICSRTGAKQVQAIGNTLTLYRANPDKPGIKLVRP